jgi:hypothetical protein
MYCIIPVSVNECNLREVYTIAPREVRQMGNDDVRREMMTYGRKDALSIDLIHSGSLRLAICSCVYSIYIARKFIIIQVYSASNSTVSCDALSIDLIHSGSLRHAYNM